MKSWPKNGNDKIKTFKLETSDTIKKKKSLCEQAETIINLGACGPTYCIIHATCLCIQAETLINLYMGPGDVAVIL
jgi:hypothetical protein